MTIDLITGHRYRVIIRPTGRQKYPRMMVGDYIGERSTGLGTELLFSLRPQAGTTGVYLCDLQDIIPVSTRTPITLPRIY